MERSELIEKLAYKWREAENYYLETQDDSKKWEVKEYQDSLNLTEEELNELHDIGNSMGL